MCSAELLIYFIITFIVSKYYESNSILILSAIIIQTVNSSGPTKYDQWTLGDPLLVRDSWKMAVGYDDHNDTIWLIGGTYPYKQLVAFKDNKFTDNSEPMSFANYGIGQFYTQINDLLYMIDTEGASFNTFNVQTLERKTQINALEMSKVGYHACLVSVTVGSDDYLIVTGGLNSAYLNTVQIYNINSDTWVSGAPSMQINRGEHSCAVHNQLLYVIGGSTGTESNQILLNSIEALNVSNITNIGYKQWHFIGNLSSPRRGSRAVVYDTDIIVIGGNLANDIIDAITNTVRLGGDLAYEGYTMATIVVYPFIYAFGGKDSSDVMLNKWQYHQLASSVNTTASPTTTDSYLSTTTHQPTDTVTQYDTTSSDIVPDYDATINISYSIIKLTLKNLNSLESDSLNILSDILTIIETNYLSKIVMKQTDLSMLINNVNGQKLNTKIRLGEDDNVTLNCQMFSYSDLVGILIRTSKSDIFKDNVTTDLISYFNNGNLSFMVTNILYDEPTINIPTEPIKSYEIYIASVCIVGTGLMFSIIIKILNTRKNSIVDNAKWLAPLFFSLQIFDFISDINLSYDILTNPLIYSDDRIFWCGILSVVFIILPFASNLYFGIYISKQKIIQNNKLAETYFANTMMVFIPFIVISSGCHPSLVMVSSRIFDLDSLSCGLTKHELHKLLKIKMYSTIPFEDIPQLIILIIYSLLTIKISSAIVMAFIASLLSIITTIAIYISYKITTKNATIISYHLRFCNNTENQLTKDQNDNILQKKGRKEELEKSIARAFNTPHMNIEIGYITLISNGIELYIVQFIPTIRLAGSFDNAIAYLQHFYSCRHQTMYKNVNTVFRNHFLINNPNFVVKFVADNDMSPEIEFMKSNSKGYAKVSVEVNDNV